MQNIFTSWEAANFFRALPSYGGGGGGACYWYKFGKGT